MNELDLFQKGKNISKLYNQSTLRVKDKLIQLFQQMQKIFKQKHLSRRKAFDKVGIERNSQVKDDIILNLKFCNESQ